MTDRTRDTIGSVTAVLLVVLLMVGLQLARSPRIDPVTPDTPIVDDVPLGPVVADPPVLPVPPGPPPRHRRVTRAPTPQFARDTQFSGASR